MKKSIKNLLKIAGVFVMLTATFTGCQQNTSDSNDGVLGITDQDDFNSRKPDTVMAGCSYYESSNELKLTFNPDGKTFSQEQWGNESYTGTYYLTGYKKGDKVFLHYSDNDTWVLEICMVQEDGEISDLYDTEDEFSYYDSTHRLSIVY